MARSRVDLGIREGLPDESLKIGAEQRRLLMLAVFGIAGDVLDRQIVASLPFRGVDDLPLAGAGPCNGLIGQHVIKAETGRSLTLHLVESEAGQLPGRVGRDQLRYRAIVIGIGVGDDGVVLEVWRQVFDQAGANGGVVEIAIVAWADAAFVDYVTIA